MAMFQPFKRATRAQTPDLSTATAQQGILDSQAKQRSNALRQQNIGNSMMAAKLYNENVDGTPIADFMGSDPMAGYGEEAMADQATADIIGTESGADMFQGTEMVLPDAAAGSNASIMPAEYASTTATGTGAGTAAGAGAGTTAGAGAGTAGAGTAAAGAGTAAAGSGGAAAGSGAASALGTAMPYVGAAMALYALLNQ